MPDFPLSFLETKQQLEEQMSGRQKRLMKLLTGQCRCENQERDMNSLEEEIENRKIAIEKLDAQRCDYCGTKVEVRESLLVYLTDYTENLPATDMMVEKVCIRAKCSSCARKGSGGSVATKEEIGRAYGILTPKEVVRLKKHAYRLVRHLGRASLGSTGEDMYQQALALTFDGRKRWYKDRVNFYGHLSFAIKNTAFRWKQKFKQWEPTLEADIITRNAEGEEVSPLESVASSDPPADQWLAAKEQVELIFRRYENDKEVTAVLNARRDGMTTAQAIMDSQNLSKRQYEGAQRRIACQKSCLVIEEDNQVLGLLVRWLKAMDFAVMTASVADEALRLHVECGPFDVVILSHLNRVDGVQIASELRKMNPSQRIILTTTYSAEEYGDRSPEIPILFKPFRKSQFQALIQSSANTAGNKPAHCFRPKKRRDRISRMKTPRPIRSSRSHAQ